MTPAAARCCGGHRLLSGFIRSSPPPTASALLHCAGTRGPSGTRRSRLGARRVRQHRAPRRRAAARRSQSRCSPVAAPPASIRGRQPAASHEARPSLQFRTGVPSAAPPPQRPPPPRGAPPPLPALTPARPRSRGAPGARSAPALRAAQLVLPSLPSPPLPAPQAHRVAQRCGFTAHGRGSASRARTPGHG